MSLTVYMNSATHMRAGPHVALRGKAVTFDHTLVLPHYSGQIMTMIELTSQLQSNRILFSRVLPDKPCLTSIMRLREAIVMLLCSEEVHLMLPF